MYEDEKLKKAVLAALRRERGINAAHIGIAANAGVVTLMGHVENFAQKKAAEMRASQVWGV